MNKIIQLLLLAVVPSFFAMSAWAGCHVTDGASKTPVGKADVEKMPIEKKALVALNGEFADLKVLERAFKAEIQTCTSCTGKYISCD